MQKGDRNPSDDRKRERSGAPKAEGSSAHAHALPNRGAPPASTSQGHQGSRQPHHKHQHHHSGREQGSKDSKRQRTDREGGGPERYEPALDFLSPQFDAVRALQTPGLSPPDPSAPLLDNLSKCRSILPPEHPESLQNLVKVTSTEERREKSRRFKERFQRRVDQILGADQRTPWLVQLMQGCPAWEEPFRTLHDCVESGAQVRVTLRRPDGSTGTATGVVTFFDSELNLVMRDVEDAFFVSKVDRERVEKPTDPRKRPPTAPSATAALAAQPPLQAWGRISAGPGHAPNPFYAPAAHPARPQESEWEEPDPETGQPVRFRLRWRQELKKRTLRHVMLMGSQVIGVDRVPAGAQGAGGEPAP